MPSSRIRTLALLCLASSAAAAQAQTAAPAPGAGASPPAATAPGNAAAGQGAPGSTAPGATAPSNGAPGSATPGTPATGNPATGNPAANGPGSNAPGSNAPGSNAPGSNAPGSNAPGAPTPMNPTAPSDPNGSPSANGAALPGGQSSLGPRQGILNDTGARNPAQDNAQLGASQTAQNLTREGGQGATRDNALAEQARQRDAFANAPEQAAPGNARPNAAFGAPSPGTTQGTGRPENQAPIPGTSGTTPAETYVINTTSGPVGPGGVVLTNGRVPHGAVRAAANARAAGGPRPEAASPSQVNDAARPAAATRIRTYGPKGGDNVMGQRRLDELEGHFSFSDERRKAERKRARAEARSRPPSTR